MCALPSTGPVVAVSQHVGVVVHVSSRARGPSRSLLLHRLPAWHVQGRAGGQASVCTLHSRIVFKRKRKHYVQHVPQRHLSRSLGSQHLQGLSGAITAQDKANRCQQQQRVPLCARIRASIGGQDRRSMLGLRHRYGKGARRESPLQRVQGWDLRCYASNWIVHALRFGHLSARRQAIIVPSVPSSFPRHGCRRYSAPRLRLRQRA